MDYRFCFFAGGEFREGQNNAFTADFIRYQSELLGDRFSLVEGIYSDRPLVNVIRALNRAQKPLENPGKDRLVASSVKQILALPSLRECSLTLVSSSYGSVIAAQAACMLGSLAGDPRHFAHPFNLALGASMVSVHSDLFARLLELQAAGVIGKLIYHELQDKGDNSTGIGGKRRSEAYLNGLGICFPRLSGKYNAPSFLNTHPVKGHLHRVRSKSPEKAKDFIRVLFVEQELAGDEVKQTALQILSKS